MVYLIEMKRIAVIIICLFSLLSGKAQYIVAGTHGSIYVDIVPDTLLDAPTVQSHQLYYIDINMDGINDIKLDSYLSASLRSDFEYVAVSALNSNTSFSYGNMDSTCTTLPPSCVISGDSILKIYNNGDTISTGIYSSSQYLAFSYYYSPPLQGNPVTSTNSSEWVNIGDKYFGVRFVTSIDTSFGWVKVNVTRVRKCLVEEYSLGVNGIGVQLLNRTNNYFSVYPNPINSILNIEIQNKNAEVRITNLLGEEVNVPSHAAAGSSQGEKFTFDVSSLQNGIYFVNVKTSEGSFTKKVVVQH